MTDASDVYDLFNSLLFTYDRLEAVVPTIESVMLDYSRLLVLEIRFPRTKEIKTKPGMIDRLTNRPTNQPTNLASVAFMRRSYSFSLFDIDIDIRTVHESIPYVSSN